LDGADFDVAGIQGIGECLVHRRWVFAFDEMDLVAVRFEQLADVLIAAASQNGRAGHAFDLPDIWLDACVLKFAQGPHRERRTQFPVVSDLVSSEPLQLRGFRRNQ
jgi:hypothetical protein